MDILVAFLYVAFAPIFEAASIFGAILLVVIPIYLFIEKTSMGDRFKDMTPWLGWTSEDQDEDEYTNFVIHAANYIKVPNSR